MTVFDDLNRKISLSLALFIFISRVNTCAGELSMKKVL